MYSLTNKWVIIQAYKHNGELHRQWSHSFVIEDNDKYFIVASIRSSVIENDGRKWHTKEPAIFILSKEKWFNVIAMLKTDGISYYVNIASPSILDKGFIKYIDYDLDVKMYSDGSTKLLDVSEYKKHSSELNYPEEIKEILNKSVDEVYHLMNKKVFPFDDQEILRFYELFQRKTNQLV